MKPMSLSGTNVRLGQRFRSYFQRRPRRHDPMLVLSMAIFNFESGWNRIFNPVRARENGPWGT